MKQDRKLLKIKTVKEAVKFLKDDLRKSDLQEIKDCETEYEMIGLCHRQLGQWIRNNMGLWKGNPTLLEDTGKTHADDASGVILRALWGDLKKGKLGLTRAERINIRIAKLNEMLKAHQEECPHHDVVSEYKSNTGNYDPSSDKYWINYTCPLCLKHWSEDQ